MSQNRTGWPPGLLQDDYRKLSRWLANRPGARRQVREVCAAIRARSGAQDEGKIAP